MKENPHSLLKKDELKKIESKRKKWMKLIPMFLRALAPKRASANKQRIKRTHKLNVVAITLMRNIVANSINTCKRWDNKKLISFMKVVVNVRIRGKTCIMLRNVSYCRSFIISFILVKINMHIIQIRLINQLT